MRQLPPENPFVDCEGFPQDQIVLEQRRLNPSRDQENGEVARVNVCTLRRQPETRRKMRLTLHNNNALLPVPYPLVRNQQRFGRFRIQDALQRGRVRLRPRGMVFKRDFCMPFLPELQTCIYLKEGVEVKRVVKPAKPVHPSLGPQTCGPIERRERFRVPVASLPPNHNEEKIRAIRTVCVNIWEEFLYGKAVLDSHVNEGEDRDTNVHFIRRFLESYLPVFAVNVLIFSSYFILYFASCCIYNNFWQFFGYILLMDHLRIHERADDSKLDVEFTGSLFQGPAYAMVRNWCEHCNQRERAKVVRNLMPKMKIDIMANKRRTALKQS